MPWYGGFCGGCCPVVCCRARPTCSTQASVSHPAGFFRAAPSLPGRAWATHVAVLLQNDARAIQPLQRAAGIRALDRIQHLTFSEHDPLLRMLELYGDWIAPSTANLLSSLPCGCRFMRLHVDPSHTVAELSEELEQCLG